MEVVAVARYVQRYNEETGKNELIEIDTSSRVPSDGHFVHGDIEPFRSPLDGSVVSDRGQLRRHMAKHGVVPAADYSTEYYQKKESDRKLAMQGGGERESRDRKQKLYDNLIAAERRNGWT